MTDLLTLRDTVKGILAAVPGLNVHTGEAITVALDPDGKAHPYAVLFVSPGRDDDTEEDLAGTPGPRDWTFQVTAAGGDDTRALWAAQRVLDALISARVMPGASAIRVLTDPGVVQIDPSATPLRSFVPLLFQAVIPKE